MNLLIWTPFIIRLIKAGISTDHFSRFSSSFFRDTPFIFENFRGIGIFEESEFSRNRSFRGIGIFEKSEFSRNRHFRVQKSDSLIIPASQIKSKGLIIHILNFWSFLANFYHVWSTSYLVIFDLNWLFLTLFGPKSVISTSYSSLKATRRGLI